jgi:hypothetical protein
MNKPFADDLQFLQQHTQAVVLGDPEGQALILAPQYQGRIMTSTAGAPRHNSFGWINYDLIQKGTPQPQINLYGGEERFWLAPEGGRFSIFFPPAPLDTPLQFADWRVPTCIDTDAFELVALSSHHASFQHRGRIVNRMGTEFDLGFEREVRLLDTGETAAALGCDRAALADLPYVAHESRNTLRNLGPVSWAPDTGLLSIWVLGMNAPSPQAALIVPYQSEVIDPTLPIVNADYFGTLGPDRLVVDRERHLILMLGDGNYRSKLGLTYPRTRPHLGAWDQNRQVLTLVQFNLPELGRPESCEGTVQRDQSLAYVNNVWRVAEDEYAGDVINGYNDGPNESGQRLGGFFELESLSPALALSPNQAYTHVHRTLHLEAHTDSQRQQIDHLCQSWFGRSIAEIETQMGFQS